MSMNRRKRNIHHNLSGTTAHTQYECSNVISMLRSKSVHQHKSQKSIRFSFGIYRNLNNTNTNKTLLFHPFRTLTNRLCSVAVLTSPIFSAFVTCSQRRRDSNSPCLLIGRTRLRHTFSSLVSMTRVLPCTQDTT